ncbi:MAG: hypothetical protein GQ534_05630 [Candidatus Delongbacteria bacterium]|nr:hypothetical protein [Candidatus Delongbacteria bacterium]
MTNNKVNIKGTEVSVMTKQDSDFISITDIARYKNPDEPKDVVKNWMRNKNTIEFLGLWEKLNNPNFKGVEFDPIKNEAGYNSFTMSPTKWITLTHAIGITTKIQERRYKKSPNKIGAFYFVRKLLIQLFSLQQLSQFFL